MFLFDFEWSNDVYSTEMRREQRFGGCDDTVEVLKSRMDMKNSCIELPRSGMRVTQPVTECST